MKFIQHKDGSCDMKFSLRERIIILFKGKVFFSPISLRHFGNNLVHMVMQFNERFDPKIKNKITHSDEVETK